MFVLIRFSFNSKHSLRKKKTFFTAFIALFFNGLTILVRKH